MCPLGAIRFMARSRARRDGGEKSVAARAFLNPPRPIPSPLATSTSIGDCLTNRWATLPRKNHLRSVLPCVPTTKSALSLSAAAASATSAAFDRQLRVNQDQFGAEMARNLDRLLRREG